MEKTFKWKNIYWTRSSPHKKAKICQANMARW